MLLSVLLPALSMELSASRVIIEQSMHPGEVQHQACLLRAPVGRCCRSGQIQIGAPSVPWIHIPSCRELGSRRERRVGACAVPNLLLSSLFVGSYTHSFIPTPTVMPAR